MAWFSNTKRRLLIFYIQLTIIGIALLTFGGNQPKINIMAPLFVGNPTKPNDSDQEHSWVELRRQLQTAKSVGINAVSTDIWWGLAERRGPGQYDWSFYDRLAQLIKEEGLRWIPILSFHQLGGNVGDVGYIPLPDYIWSRFQKNPNLFHNEDSLKFRSEQNNTSKEYVSFWATSLIRDDLERFMLNFRDHFSAYANIVDEINISLGPSGELRYPSYNQHDYGVGYPSRGAIQAYSSPAILGFREAMKAKYGILDNLKKNWGYELHSFDEIFPPNKEFLKGSFWQNKEQFSPYGKDFFDYYNETLVKHGQLMLSIAESVFGTQNSDFRDVALGGKIPSIHWRISSDRLAELSAGLIRTSYSNWKTLDSGFGYLDTLRVFKQYNHKMARILTFTAVEMSDHRDDYLNANSRAKTLVSWLASAAQAQNIEIEGENALSTNLNSADAWQNITDALVNNLYSKITLLRLNDITNDANRLQLLRGFNAQMQSKSIRCEDVLKHLQFFKGVSNEP